MRWQFAKNRQFARKGRLAREFRIESLEHRQVLNAAPVAIGDNYQIPAGQTLQIGSTNGPAGTLLAAGSVWRYLGDGTDQGTAWRGTAFNDAAWSAGPGELGYGDGDEATVIQTAPNSPARPVTTYFRRSLTVSDPSALANLRIRLNFDDGAVVYVNGQEVVRANLPGGVVSYQSFALTAAPEGVWQEFPISSAPFVAGENTIAVEIHQVNAQSSDISFDLELLGTGSGGEATGILLNDSDPDGDSLTAVLEAGPSNGTLVLQANGAFTYTPSVGFSGNDSFTYRASDGLATSDLTTVSIDVVDNTPPNRAPNASGDEYTIEVGQTLLAGLTPPNEGGGTGEVLFPLGSVWKYRDDGSDQGSAWRESGFNDATWFAGAGQLGYGDWDEATITNNGAWSERGVTAYFRRTFTVESLAEITSLSAHIIYDDGAVIYVNGVEVARVNMPAGPIHADTLSPTAAQDNSIANVAILANVLTEGENTLAVEVHQSSVASSDLSFDLELRALGEGDNGGGTPADNVVIAPYGVLYDDIDLDGDPISAELVSAPANGTLEFHATGAFTYTPNTGFVGTDSFVYRASDGQLFSQPTTVQIHVNQHVPPPANIPPEANDDAYVIDAGETLVTGANGNPIDTIMPRGSVWKYLDDGSDPGTAWQAAAYDDSAWSSGAGQLGYGDGDETTVISAGPNGADRNPTTYFRRTFTINDLGNIGALSAQLVHDDGAIVYLNGVEIARLLMPDGEVGYRTYAAGVSPDNAITEVSIPAHLLVQGENILAVEIHQAYGMSSDVSFDLALRSLDAAELPGVLVNDFDADGNTLIAGIVDLPNHGTIQFQANGNFTYIPDVGFAGVDSFTYRVNDGRDSSPLATVTITVGEDPGETPPTTNGAGDFDNDGDVDAADIDLLYLMVRGPVGAAGAAASPVSTEGFDLNGDSRVNQSDVDYLVGSILETSYGDATLDGATGLGDLMRVQRNIGSAGGWEQGDFDGDGIVQASDLGVLVRNFGRGGVAAAAAEALVATAHQTTSNVAQAAGTRRHSDRRASQPESDAVSETRRRQLGPHQSRTEATDTALSALTSVTRSTARRASRTQSRSASFLSDNR